ncbi:MAG: ATP-binding cassette domain-containing protein [Spirochaetes bacterium]|jgi:ABC-type multidrug transport system ATPase subunit|nr:ATP-binding cassette domain-containing protein [Spirochaetota bacterium]
MSDIENGLADTRARTPAPAAAISLRGVSLFSGTEAVFADVSISVPPGSTTLVMGPSGSGKSALLKVAAGLIPADTGTVTLLGSQLGTLAKPDERELRRRNGFVFQDAALWQNLTVFQNLALPLQYHGVTENAAEVASRVRAMAGDFGMQRRIDLRPAQLSAGERKMVSFLRAIILDPEVLFLDEPTSFVDHQGAELIIRRLRELKKRGTTMVASTHSAKISSQLADHLVVLDAGGVVAQGAFGDVVHAADRRVKEILSDVLSETASYDTDILDLLDPDG